MIEDTLEEDLLHEFKGGTLSIHPENSSSKLIKPEPVDKPSDNDQTQTNNKTNNKNDWSANFISSIPNKISAGLWNKPSKPAAPNRENNTTIQPTICITENPNNYFTFRESVLAKAMNECKEQFLDEESDGPLLQAFLLTQISHWNSDKERLVLLTPRCLVVAKYDFIALKRLGYKKLPLEMIDEVVLGELVYPSGSLIPNRNMRGIRLIWNKNKSENFTSYWNPFNEDVPFCTFTFHPLFYHKDCVDEKVKNLYSLDVFAEKICKAIADLTRNDLDQSPCFIQEKDIVLQSYLGIGSVIHNRNSLGFFKVRGKFSF